MKYISTVLPVYNKDNRKMNQQLQKMNEKSHEKGKKEKSKNWEQVNFQNTGANIIELLKYF